MKNSDWDIDLRFGELGEVALANLLSINTIEVKTDRRWIETGNLYIETECFYVSSNSWKESGLLVSKASHWALMFNGSAFILPTFRLLEAVKEIGKPITCNIPPNPSRGYLITPAQLIESMRRHIEIEERDMAEYHAETWTDPHEWEDRV